MPAFHDMVTINLGFFVGFYRFTTTQTMSEKGKALTASQVLLLGGLLGGNFDAI